MTGLEMSLEALRSRVLTEDEENMMFDGDEMPPVDDYVPAEPVIYPADLRFCVTVFYDPEVIRGDAAVNELHARMERTYDGREIDMQKLEKASLAYARLSPFPESQARFLNRGYVDNVEGRAFDQGGQTLSIYAKRNIAALTINAMLLASWLYKQPIEGMKRALRGKERWRSVWKAMAPVMGTETLHTDERDGRLMDHMEAHPGVPFDLEAKNYPLVDHQGLRLGSRRFRDPRSIHWTYDITPLGAWEAVDDSTCGAIFGAAAKVVRQQIMFEATNALYLFRPALISADAARADVTPAMIAVWYSQAIAAMRKICWLVTTEENSSLTAHALHQEEAVHGFALGAAERLPDHGRSWDQLIAEETREYGLMMARQMPPVAAGQIMTHKISLSDEILGSLMGATYNSHDKFNESPYSNPDIYIASLARWIGQLKRKRKASIDPWTADSILSFWRSERQYQPLLLSQFPQTTWQRLVEISEAMEFNWDMPEVEVTYTWTQDRMAPYKCADRDNALDLEGPLLCFPTLQAVHWREQAQIIAGFRGFEAR
jgi:hypothetical protein